jgi:hypothetical protein
MMWETNRNPMLLFELFGLFLLRDAHRALSVLLFHDPPTKTRSPSDPPRVQGALRPLRR